MHRFFLFINYMGILFMATVFSTPASFAEMYKWVDAEGNTHYSQQRPSGDIETEIIGPPSAVDNSTALKQLESDKSRADSLREARLEKAKAEQETKAEQERKKANCKLARERLASYTEPRVSFVQDDGSRIRATEEQRQEQIAKSKEMIQEFCN